MLIGVFKMIIDDLFVNENWIRRDMISFIIYSNKGLETFEQTYVVFGAVVCLLMAFEINVSLFFDKQKFTLKNSQLIAVLAGLLLFFRAVSINIVRSHSYLIGIEDFFENAYMIATLMTVSDYVNKEE